MPQDDTLPAVQQFLRWIESRHIPDLSMPDFIPSADVSEYFNDDTNGDTIKKVLKAFSPDSADPARLKIRKDFRKVFCILVSIHKGPWIRHFISHDLTDALLPFYDRPNAFPIDSSDKTFLEDFQRAQWRFCAPVLQRSDQIEPTKRYRQEIILPYVSKAKQGEGATSVVYKVEVHAAHNKLTSGRRHVRAITMRYMTGFHALYTDCGQQTMTDKPTNCVFALKTYKC